MAAPPQGGYMLEAREVIAKMPSVIKRRQYIKARREFVDDELTKKIDVAAENDLSRITYIFENENEYDWFKEKLEHLGYKVNKLNKKDKMSNAIMADIEW